MAQRFQILPLHFVKDLVREFSRSRTKLLLLPIPPEPGAERRHRGGGERNRTADLLLAKQALSQLSYTPAFQADSRPPQETAMKMVGQGGFEPPTSRLSSARSNQLSY